MHVLRARRVFDGERFVPDHGRGADVVVDGPRIVEVGPLREHSVDVRVDDLGDATILPGLVDGHQHLTWDCSPAPLAWHEAADDDALLARGRANARRALAAGITTVRDLGGRGLVTLALRDELARAPAAGPGVLAAGPALTTPGGHCWFLGGECSDVTELRSAVTRLAAAGADVVKVMVTGGNVTPGSLPHESQFGAVAVRSVVRTAHELGLPVAAHAHGTDGVAAALEAGVDTIEHATFMTAEGVARDPALVERLVRSGTPVSLTGGAAPGPLPPAIAARMPAILDHVRGLLASGARCFFSTDAGIGPPKPHDVLVQGVTQVVIQLDVAPERALAMVTGLAADALGIAGRAGRLRPGAPVDVLVVRGRVDEDVEALLRPIRVLHHGVDVLEAPPTPTPAD